MATHSSIHAWKIPWTKEPGGLQSMVSQRVGHDWVTSLQFTSYRARVNQETSQLQVRHSQGPYWAIWSTIHKGEKHSSRNLGHETLQGIQRNFNRTGYSEKFFQELKGILNYFFKKYCLTSGPSFPVLLTLIKSSETELEMQLRNCCNNSGERWWRKGPALGSRGSKKDALSRLSQEDLLRGQEQEKESKTL